MAKIAFRIQGSSPEPYEVVVEQAPDERVFVTCTCPAGQRGQLCKHRVNILTGDESGLVDAKPEEIATVQTWIKGTELEQTLENLEQLDNQAARIKAELASMKKKAARLMQP